MSQAYAFTKGAENKILQKWDKYYHRDMSRKPNKKVLNFASDFRNFKDQLISESSLKY